MFNFLKKKLEKRFYFFPIGQPIGEVSHNQSYTGSIPVIKKCLLTYRDLLLCTPLVIKEGDKLITEHDYLDLINKPNNFLTKAEFFTLLCEDYFLSGNFVSLIQSDNTGKVTALLPFIPSSIWAYPASDLNNTSNANNSDPVFLNTPGAIQYLYSWDTGKKDRDGKPVKATKNFSAEDILHFRSQFNNDGDFLNGKGLASSYYDAVSMGRETLKTGARIAENALISHTLLSGVQSDNPDTLKELEQTVSDFLKNKKMILTMPEGTEAKPLSASRPDLFFQVLSSVSALNIARIFGIPADLVSREDGANVNAGVGLKESFRFWVKTGGKAFLKIVSDKLSEILPKGLKYKFLTKQAQSSDLREFAMSLNQLVKDQIITKETAKEWLHE